MAKTISSLVSDFQVLTNDSSSSSGTVAKTLINFGVKSVLGVQDWTFNKTTYSCSSATSVQAYSKPYNAYKLDGVDYWDSNVWYSLKEIRDDKQWRVMNSTTVTGLPYSWFISNETGDIELFPIPSDSDGTIKMRYTKKIRDIGVSDYSTGSVYVADGTITSFGTTITLGRNKFVGTETSWGSIYEGRSISVLGTTYPMDGYWFEITNVSTGSILSVKEEIPSTIAKSGVAYRISELIPMPDGFEDIPLWYALDRYYQMKEKPALAREYERKYREGLGELMNRDSRSTSGLIEKQDGSGMVDPNSNPWGITLS